MMTEAQARERARAFSLVHRPWFHDDLPMQALNEFDCDFAAALLAVQAEALAALAITDEVVEAAVTAFLKADGDWAIDHGAAMRAALEAALKVWRE